MEHSSASRTRACVPALVRECGCQLGEARRAGGEPVLTCESGWPTPPGQSAGHRARRFIPRRSVVSSTTLPRWCRGAVMSVRGTSWRSTLGRVSRRRFDGSARDRHRSLGMRTATGRVAAGLFVRTCTCVCPVRPQKGAREWRTWAVGRVVSRGTVGCSSRSCMTHWLHRCSQGSPRSTARRRATALTGVWARPIAIAGSCRRPTESWESCRLQGACGRAWHAEVCSPVVSRETCGPESSPRCARSGPSLLPLPGCPAARVWGWSDACRWLEGPLIKRGPHILTVGRRPRFGGRGRHDTPVDQEPPVAPASDSLSTCRAQPVRTRRSLSGTNPSRGAEQATRWADRRREPTTQG
ncbi:hypothetical protein J2X26_000879 [Cellulomonas humilata]|uniref:Uncharacterized protein n=1 Tax=Cellulomonas humilata TaxID=144055 RepID=A0ABU0EBD8_9CELL|nr:hypothetical protein [Cellulomonas humilata]